MPTPSPQPLTGVPGRADIFEDLLAGLAPATREWLANLIEEHPLQPGPPSRLSPLPEGASKPDLISGPRDLLDSIARADAEESLDLAFSRLTQLLRSPASARSLRAQLTGGEERATASDLLRGSVLEGLEQEWQHRDESIPGAPQHRTPNPEEPNPATLLRVAARFFEAGGWANWTASARICSFILNQPTWVPAMLPVASGDWLPRHEAPRKSAPASSAPRKAGASQPTPPRRRLVRILAACLAVPMLFALVDLVTRAAGSELRLSLVFGALLVGAGLATAIWLWMDTRTSKSRPTD